MHPVYLKGMLASMERLGKSVIDTATQDKSNAERRERAVKRQHGSKGGRAASEISRGTASNPES